MLKINEMLLKLEYFQYYMSLYLDMSYYHIQLSKNSSNLCTIILPWAKYHCNNLPMGVANSPDILQQKMNDSFHGLEFICACIYDILILTKVVCTDHVQKLVLMLNKLNGKLLE